MSQLYQYLAGLSESSEQMGALYSSHQIPIINAQLQKTNSQQIRDQLLEELDESSFRGIAAAMTAGDPGPDPDPDPDPQF